MLFDLAAATIVDKDLEVHFSLAAEFVDVAEELTLIGADGFAQHLVVSKYGAEPEGKYGGLLKTIGDHTSVIDARFLVEGFPGVMLADDYGEITGGVKKNLIATYAKD